jgi:hypothetical protein
MESTKQSNINTNTNPSNLCTSDLHTSDLCSQIDHIGQSYCMDKPVTSEYSNVCSHHAQILHQRDEEERKKEEAEEFHKKYIYCGSHWEKSAGTIYHYILKERLGERSITELSSWDFDYEVWYDNLLYQFCGPNISL